MKTVLRSAESTFEILFGNHGRCVLQDKEKGHHQACYQHTVQQPASVVAWGRTASWVITTNTEWYIQVLELKNRRSDTNRSKLSTVWLYQSLKEGRIHSNHQKSHACPFSTSAGEIFGDLQTEMLRLYRFWFISEPTVQQWLHLNVWKWSSEVLSFK